MEILQAAYEAISRTFLYDDEGRLFARRENLPIDVKAEDLTTWIAAALVAHTDATNHFASAEQKKLLDAAEEIGAGFAALDPFLPGTAASWILNEGETSRGAAAFGCQWKILRKLDPKDATGWQARFLMKDGYQEVTRADQLAKEKGCDEAMAYVESLREKNATHWTIEQRQAVDMAEFAVLRRLDRDAQRRKELLERIAKADGETIWGAAARGYRALMDDPNAWTPMPLLSVEPTAQLDPENFRAIVEGDDLWRREFYHSGPIQNVDTAFRRLEELIRNCGGEELMKPCPMRRLATAMALNCSKRTAGEQIATFQAYQKLFERGRLHRSVMTHKVYDWRWVIENGAEAREILLANSLANCPTKEMADAYAIMPQRMYNCFGEFVHNQRAYYGPWYIAGWKPLKTALHVGAVCVGVSHCGVYIHLSHGRQAVACGQPGHCSYATEDMSGKWKIQNHISPPTVPKFRIFDFPGFSPIDVMTELYSTSWERTCEADELAEVGAYERALEIQPLNPWIRQKYLVELVENKADEEKIRRAVDAAIEVLADRREVYWLVMHAYCEAVAKTDPIRAADELARFHSLVRTDGEKAAEELNYDIILYREAVILKKIPKEMIRIYEAALKATAKNSKAFTVVLKKGGQFVEKYPEFRARFYEMVASIEGKGLDYSSMIRSACKAGDFAAFRQASELNDRANPSLEEGEPYPTERKGAKLISPEGLLQTSSVHPRLDRPSRYMRALDPKGIKRGYASFYTKAESEAWAQIAFEDVREVSSIFLDNRMYDARNVSRQFPLEVHVSEDGEIWTKVTELREPIKDIEIDFDTPIRAKFIRLVRSDDGTRRFFALYKFLVYGR